MLASARQSQFRPTIDTVCTRPRSILFVEFAATTTTRTSAPAAPARGDGDLGLGGKPPPNGRRARVLDPSLQAAVTEMRTGLNIMMS